MPHIQKIKRIIQLLQAQNVSFESIWKTIEASLLMEQNNVSSQHTIPFTVGLQLTEPSQEKQQEEWSLHVFLQDKANPDVKYDYLDKAAVPSNWTTHLPTVDQQVILWKSIYPWLRFEKVNATMAGKFLTEAAEVFLLLEVPILLPSWWETITKAKVQARARIRSNRRYQSSIGLSSFVDFEWNLSINSQKISEEDFNKIIQDKTTLYLLNGQWVSLDLAAMKRLQKILLHAKQAGISPYDILKKNISREYDQADDAFITQLEYEFDTEFTKYLPLLQENIDIPLRHVPASFFGELRPYQQYGMSWLLYLRELGFGCCLADEMGLGKTIQLIAYILYIKEKHDSNPKKPSLIVCPTSVLGNWQKELQKFAPSLTVAIHNGSNRPRHEQFSESYQSIDIVLTNYSLLAPDEEAFMTIEWDTIVLDEAQNIKNPNTKQSKTARKLPAMHHIAMTGTPIENRLYELWTIFDFINKGYLHSLSKFERQFCHKIEKEKDLQQLALLKKLIHPFLLRRTKKDEHIALNLPDKIEELEYISLSQEQSTLYEEIVARTLEKIEKEEGIERAGLVLQMITRLKQVCNHPALLFQQDEAFQSSKHQSSKLDKLYDLVDSILEQEESVIIFTQFAKMGSLIKMELEKKYGITIPFIQGSLSRIQREKAIEEFQNGLSPVLLLTLKTGGTGLNLTAANHVIHFDRWWNPAIENQATDRAHRIGQSKFVHVHKLITVGTLEEKIHEILESKQSLSNDLLLHDNWLSKLSNEELKSFITLDK